MEKHQGHALRRERVTRLVHDSGKVVGSVVTKGAEEAANDSKGPKSEGTGVEEKALGTKDAILTNLEKYEHIKAAGSYLTDAHKNNKEASKRIRSSKRETKKAYNDSSLVQKKRSGEALTESEKKDLKDSKKRMNRYNKAVKKEERFMAGIKNQSAYEKAKTRKRRRLEHLSDLEQLTNYGSGDGQGTGVEENMQDNLAGVTRWAERRMIGAVKDLNSVRKSHLEQKSETKKVAKYEPGGNKEDGLQGKHVSKDSKRSRKRFEEKPLTKEEKHRMQKKRLQKKRRKILMKNDKLSGAVSKITDVVKSKGVRAAVIGMLGPILIIICVIVVLLLIMAAIGGVSGEMHEHASYQAEDETLLLSNKVVVDKEKKDKKDIMDTETNHPTASDGGPFNEYQYALNGTLMSKDALIARIKHDGNLIASYLTAKYFDYTLTGAIKNELKQIYEEAFKLEQYEEIQARVSTYTDPNSKVTYYWNGTGWQTAACTYRYAIFHTDLTITPLDDVLRAHLDTEEQIRFYELYKSTSGQKDYLFGGTRARDDIYRYKYDPEEYKAIYGVADISFSDAEAQQIYNVASSQLGRPYHWGGSSLATGFDCSGYVYWVMNTSGVAHFPRTSANVILHAYCDPISPEEAKPGDLIFFQGTYATVGASHVGIFLGNNQMIHCGDPIKITSITTNYWTSHFYTYGRIKDEFK